MNIFEFIFGILALIIVFISVVGYIAMKYDTRKLEEENAKLREDLHKARKRKMEREYKKAKEVK